MAREEKSNVINRDMNKDEKLKALDAALTQIEKAYGKGSVMKLGDSRANMNIETVPTGSISLDIALGLGGVPKGRIVEVYGPERPRSPCTWWQRYRSAEALQASLTRSMPWILYMPGT